MNIEEMKKTGLGTVNVTDSLSGPLLKLNIKLKENGASNVPENENLIISISNSVDNTTEPKEYLYNIYTPLGYVGEISDEFVLEPIIKDNKLLYKTYIIRRVANSTALEEEIIEELETQMICLFEGTNFIYTNYSNAEIEIIYPKNIDEVKVFMNNALYMMNNSNKVLSLDDIYFKDCFTEVDSKINAEFNKTTTKCFDSPTNAFSMDCEGNLVVNTITTRENTGSNIDMDMIYPVGSIYMSVNNMNPTNLFGGMWEQITDRFLLGAGTNHAALTTGGEETHMLTVNEMPNHQHNNSLIIDGNIVRWNGNGSELNLCGATIPWNGGGEGSSNIYTGSTGNSEAHNNMPPYLAVYIWKRVA